MVYFCTEFSVKFNSYYWNVNKKAMILSYTVLRISLRILFRLESPSHLVYDVPCQLSGSCSKFGKPIITLYKNWKHQKSIEIIWYNHKNLASAGSFMCERSRNRHGVLNEKSTVTLRRQVSSISGQLIFVDQTTSGIWRINLWQFLWKEEITSWKICSIRNRLHLQKHGSCKKYFAESKGLFNKISE